MLTRAERVQSAGSLAKAAERFLRRQVELEDASAFHDAPAARAEHAARMNEAQGPPGAISVRVTPEFPRRRDRSENGLTVEGAADPAHQGILRAAHALERIHDRRPAAGLGRSYSAVGEVLRDFGVIDTADY